MAELPATMGQGIYEENLKANKKFVIFYRQKR